MKKLILGAVALSLLTGPVAFGQGYNSDRGSDRDRSGNYNPGGWQKGQRLPAEYRQERNHYYGWRDSGLRKPPRGYAWMLVGNQFLLTQSGTGRIAEVAFVPSRDTVDRDDRRDRDDRGDDRNNDRGDRDRDGGYRDNRDDNRGREDQWRARYGRSYSYNDDAAYTECKNKPDPAGVLAGAFLGGLLGNAAGGRRDGAGPTVAGVIAGGAIGAALTNKMECEDRSYAYDSYSRGFNSGRADSTVEWRNPRNNHRGEMHVLDYYRDEDGFRCSVFSQTVYIGGQREEARGRACQQPDGTWAIID